MLVFGGCTDHRESKRQIQLCTETICLVILGVQRFFVAWFFCWKCRVLNSQQGFDSKHDIWLTRHWLYMKWILLMIGSWWVPVSRPSLLRRIRLGCLNRPSFLSMNYREFQSRNHHGRFVPNTRTAYTIFGRLKCQHFCMQFGRFVTTLCLRLWLKEKKNHETCCEKTSSMTWSINIWDLAVHGGIPYWDVSNIMFYESENIKRIVSNIVVYFVHCFGRIQVGIFQKDEMKTEIPVPPRTFVCLRWCFIFYHGIHHHYSLPFKGNIFGHFFQAPKHSQTQGTQQTFDFKEPNRPKSYDRSDQPLNVSGKLSGSLDIRHT